MNIPFHENCLLLCELGTAFINFKTGCTGKKDVIVTTNPNNDDAQHPLRMAGISLSNVDVGNKVFIHRANIE